MTIKDRIIFYGSMALILGVTVFNPYLEYENLYIIIGLVFPISVILLIIFFIFYKIFKWKIFDDLIKCIAPGFILLVLMLLFTFIGRLIIIITMCACFLFLKILKLLPFSQTKEEGNSLNYFNDKFKLFIIRWNDFSTVRIIKEFIPIIRVLFSVVCLIIIGYLIFNFLTSSHYDGGFINWLFTFLFINLLPVLLYYFTRWKPFKFYLFLQSIYFILHMVILVKAGNSWQSGGLQFAMSYSSYYLTLIIDKYQLWKYRRIIIILLLLLLLVVFALFLGL